MFVRHLSPLLQMILIGDEQRINTGKSYQSAAPRGLNEKMLWNRVIENPSAGRDTELAGDKDFPRSEGEWK